MQTGSGELLVKAPRVRDRAGELKFSSSILPRYLRRTRSLEELLPWLYLKGLSTGDFSSALTALLGKDAPGLSATTISRLKEVWKSEYEQWSKLLALAIRANNHQNALPRIFQPQPKVDPIGPDVDILLPVQAVSPP